MQLDSWVDTICYIVNTSSNHCIWLTQTHVIKSCTNSNRCCGKHLTFVCTLIRRNNCTINEMMFRVITINRNHHRGIILQDGTVSKGTQQVAFVIFSNIPRDITCDPIKHLTQPHTYLETHCVRRTDDSGEQQFSKWFLLCRLEVVADGVLGHQLSFTGVKCF